MSRVYNFQKAKMQLEARKLPTVYFNQGFSPGQAALHDVRELNSAMQGRVDMEAYCDAMNHRNFILAHKILRPGVEPSGGDGAA